MKRTTRALATSVTLTAVAAGVILLATSSSAVAATHRPSRHWPAPSHRVTAPKNVGLPVDIGTAAQWVHAPDGSVLRVR